MKKFYSGIKPRIQNIAQVSSNCVILIVLILCWLFLGSLIILEQVSSKSPQLLLEAPSQSHMYSHTIWWTTTYTQHLLSSPSFALTSIRKTLTFKLLKSLCCGYFSQCSAWASLIMSWLECKRFHGDSVFPKGPSFKKLKVTPIPGVLNEPPRVK